MGAVIDSRTMTASGDAGDTLLRPRIGWHTIPRDGRTTMTASAETAGTGEHANAWREGLTHDFWRPGSSGTHWLRAHAIAALKVNYLGIAAHDLHATAGKVKLQHSTDGGGTWSDSSAEHLPGDSSPFMLLFDDVVAADYRLLVVSDKAVSIGVVMFGEVMAIPAPIIAPWPPPYLSRRVSYVSERAERGAFLGRSIVAEGADLALVFHGLREDWVRGTWEPALRQIEQYPFFFAARDLDEISDRAQEVVYAWTTAQPQASYETGTSMKLEIEARALIT